MGIRQRRGLYPGPARGVAGNARALRGDGTPVAIFGGQGRWLAKSLRRSGPFPNPTASITSSAQSHTRPPPCGPWRGSPNRLPSAVMRAKERPIPRPRRERKVSAAQTNGCSRNGVDGSRPPYRARGRLLILPRIAIPNHHTGERTRDPATSLSSCSRRIFLLMRELLARAGTPQSCGRRRMSPKKLANRRRDNYQAPVACLRAAAIAR